MTANKSDKDILKDKERLANDSLELAKDALLALSGSIEDCSVRDLLGIFSTAVKIHRDIASDIILIRSKESPEEESLAKDKGYTSKVGMLLQQLKPPGDRSSPPTES